MQDWRQFLAVIAAVLATSGVTAASYGVLASGLLAGVLPSLWIRRRRAGTGSRPQRAGVARTRIRCSSEVNSPAPARPRRSAAGR